jgi:hypothetical protein
LFCAVQEEDAAWERVAKEVFVNEAQPPPSPSAFSSSQPGASAATTRGLILKGVKWRLPTPTTTEVAGEGMEGKAEPEVRFVPHEQFDSAPLPVNKFRWPYVYLYVAICKVSQCLPTGVLSLVAAGSSLIVNCAGEDRRVTRMAHSGPRSRTGSQPCKTNSRFFSPSAERASRPHVK